MSLITSDSVLWVGQSGAVQPVFAKKQGGGVAYRSTNEEILTVTANGVITAMGSGTAEIVATAYNGVEARCEVRVIESAAELRLPETIEMGRGERIVLPAQALQADGAPYQGEISVRFAKKDFLTYDDGMLTAMKTGTVMMEVKAGELTKTCEVVIKPYHQIHTVKSVAHRGGCGYWPENTLEAFRNVATTGADMVELDVQTTKDGVQAVNHDLYITVAGKKYAVADYTMDELRAMKPDLCTLDEALEVLRETDMEIQLELKISADGAACVEAVRRHGLQNRVIYISFETPRLNEVRAADSSAKLGMLFRGKVPSSAYKTMERLGVKAILPKYSAVKSADVLKWHSMGYEVGVWPLTTEKEIRTYINMGVDYITSDWPDRIVDAR